MHPNARLIENFYGAFAERDHATMAACYDPDSTFSDPVFPELRGARIGWMWRMLCEAGADLVIEFEQVEANDDTGRAHWDARYTFATGRKVHNHIDASFTFCDGGIATHVDRFDLWAWTRMALGPTGWLLGWTPMVQGRVRAQAARGLERFIEKHG